MCFINESHFIMVRKILLALCQVYFASFLPSQAWYRFALYSTPRSILYRARDFSRGRFWLLKWKERCSRVAIDTLWSWNETAPSKRPATEQVNTCSNLWFDLLVKWFNYKLCRKCWIWIHLFTLIHPTKLNSYDCTIDRQVRNRLSSPLSRVSLLWLAVVSTSLGNRRRCALNKIKWLFR